MGFFSFAIFTNLLPRTCHFSVIAPSIPPPSLDRLYLGTYIIYPHATPSLRSLFHVPLQPYQIGPSSLQYKSPELPPTHPPGPVSLSCYPTLKCQKRQDVSRDLGRGNRAGWRLVVRFPCCGFATSKSKADLYSGRSGHCARFWKTGTSNQLLTTSLFLPPPPGRGY